MLGSHLNMFIWQDVLLLFLFILSPLLRLPQSTRKGRCALGQEGSGSLRIAAGGLPDGPLEVRRMARGTDSLPSRPLRLVPPGLPESAARQFWGARGCRQWLRGSACATSGCRTPECRRVRFRGVSHRIVPLLRPFTRCLCRGEGWVRADASVPKSCWELWNEGRRRERCQRCRFSPSTPTSVAAFALCVVPWVCLEAARNPALAALPCLQASPPPHPRLSETFDSP